MALVNCISIENWNSQCTKLTDLVIMTVTIQYSHALVILRFTGFFDILLFLVLCHYNTLRSIQILSSHLHFLRGLFPSEFQTKIMYTFLITPVHATCPAPPWFYYLNIIIGEAYMLWSSSLCSLQPPVTSCLIGPFVLISTLYSITLNLSQECIPHKFGGMSVVYF